jgi:tetratricopeptide (TPR) repeat protein
VVAEICRRLDGLPLAIELAAARVKVLPPQALLACLRDRLTLLIDGARDLPARQRTLRGTIDWSYELLDERERALFRRLAVFAGGGTLPALAAVCVPDGVPTVDVLGGVTILADQSLVRQDAAGDGELRFAMLETIREYAQERLAASGEEPALRQRHAGQYLALVEAAGLWLWGPEQLVWLDRLEREDDNLRAALDWSVARAAGAGAVAALVPTLSWFWYLHGHLGEGRRRLAVLLVAGGGLAAGARARVLVGAGFLAYGQGDLVGAAALLAEGQALARAADDRRALVRSLLYLGFTVRDQGDYARSATLLAEGLALAEALDDRWGVAYALYLLGLTTHSQGDFAGATDLAEASLVRFRAEGERFGTAYALIAVGDAADERGDHDRAGALLEESLALSRALGNWRGIGFVLRRLGRNARSRGDLEQAAARYAEALLAWRELGNRARVAEGLESVMDFLWAPERQCCVEVTTYRRMPRFDGLARGKHKALPAPLSFPRLSRRWRRPRGDAQVHN